MRRPAKQKVGVGEAAAPPKMQLMDNEGEEPQRQFWLLKTEPDCWSWKNQEDNEGLSVWDGVRNVQAQKLMKSMSVDDLCLFYHTGKLRQVEGIVRVVKTFYPDPTDDSGKWGAVDVKEVEAFKQPVTLATMKGDDRFKGFLMLRQPRLSVVPVDESIWRRLCELGGAEKAEPLAVKEAAPTAGAPVQKTKKKAEVKGGGSGKTENGIPTETATATSTRRSRRSSTEAQAVETIANGRTEETVVKAGTRARKRGGSSKEEVIDEAKTPANGRAEETIVKTGTRARKRGGSSKEEVIDEPKTTANGRTEETVVKAGTRARKREGSSKEVIDEPKKKVPKKGGTEKIEETPSGSRTAPKTRRKNAS